jgi:hypothetical protein
LLQAYSNKARLFFESPISNFLFESLFFVIAVARQQGRIKTIALFMTTEWLPLKIVTDCTMAD